MCILQRSGTCSYDTRGPPEVTDGRQPEGSTQVQPGSWWPCGRALVDTIAGALHFFTTAPRTSCSMKSLWETSLPSGTGRRRPEAGPRGSSTRVAEETRRRDGSQSPAPMENEAPKDTQNNSQWNCNKHKTGYVIINLRAASGAARVPPGARNPAADGPERAP